MAASIRGATPDPRVVFLTALNGMIVPGIRSTAGTVPLHSLYDPRRESLRLADACRGAGCLVIGGLGAGYHVTAVLEDSRTNAVIIMEKDASVLRSMLSRAPLARIFADPRVTVVSGMDEIRKAIVTVWHPALMGGLRSLFLRSWCDLERAFFNAAAASIEAAIQEVREDYSVQSHFGKRWLANILVNLSRIEAVPPAEPGGNAAAVTAAGPSLERHLPLLAENRRKEMLIATDTSLPTLIRAGIRPDGVLSIDCQNHGYHHFLNGIPAGTTLYLDLASPPFLARRFPIPCFVASGHPFVRYVESHWRRLRRIDTSGGNVTHASVSLARSLGARHISVYGADFCYPDGKAYARGTYLYDYFWTDQDRVSPAEARFFSFVFGSGSAGSPRPTRETRSGRILYTTPVLQAYRDRFIQLMDSIDAEVETVPSDGFVLRHGQKKGPGPSPARGAERSGGRGLSSCGWREFLHAYARDIEALPPASTPFNEAEAELWHTLLSVAASVVREGSAPGPGALEEARRWALGRIRRVLGSDEGTDQE